MKKRNLVKTIVALICIIVGLLVILRRIGENPANAPRAKPEIFNSKMSGRVIMPDPKIRPEYILDEKQLSNTIKQAENGDTNAMFELADWYGRKGDDQSMKYWIKMQKFRQLPNLQKK